MPPGLPTVAAALLPTARPQPCCHPCSPATMAAAGLLVSLLDELEQLNLVTDGALSRIRTLSRECAERAAAGLARSDAEGPTLRRC